MDAPTFGQHAQFFDRVEEFAIEELVAQFGVEAFAVAVLPGRAGFDVECLCACVSEPFAQVFSNETPTRYLIEDALALPSIP